MGDIVELSFISSFTRTVDDVTIEGAIEQSSLEDRAPLMGLLGLVPNLFLAFNDAKTDLVLRDEVDVNDSEILVVSSSDNLFSLSSTNFFNINGGSLVVSSVAFLLDIIGL